MKFICRSELLSLEAAFEMPKQRARKKKNQREIRGRSEGDQRKIRGRSVR
jgi:hypothetical protein